MSKNETLKTLKDIAHIPAYVRDTWHIVRDNGIDESVAHSRQTRHDKEMLEKMDALTKKQEEMWSLLATRFNKMDDKIERLSKQSEMASKTEIIEILRGHFDEISIDLDHHDITCSSEDAVNSLQSEVENLSTQVQDIVNTVNDGFNEIKEMLKNKNVLINPGESVIVSVLGAPKDAE
jgi:transcriptional regulator of heat shock response